MTDAGPVRILVAADLTVHHRVVTLDEELKQLDLAIAESRLLADEAIAALGSPKARLRAAAADYIESVAVGRIDATRRDAVAVMSQLSDDDVADLRFWTQEEVARARAAVESEIETCDFWIVATSGLSLTDVSTYAAALVPRPKDTKTGIPQTLVLLFEQCLQSLRRGLGVVGLPLAPAVVEPGLELALVRAWQTYRAMAVECLVTWADIDDRYQASAARFQEMRWELAEVADVTAIEARRTAVDPDELEGTVTADVQAEAELPSAIVSDHFPSEATNATDAEGLIPVSG